MKLEFSVNTLNNPIFNWLCPICNEIKPYIPVIKLDFANDDFKPLINSLNRKTIEEQEIVVYEIKSQMINILNHFIECKKGWHYNAMFKHLIKPYLDNPLVLDFVLSSDAIKDNEINERSGSKIYPELLLQLKKVNSTEIKNYLDMKFKIQ